MWMCPKCQEINDDANAVCQKCGTAKPIVLRTRPRETRAIRFTNDIACSFEIMLSRHITSSGGVSSEVDRAHMSIEFRRLGLA